MSETSRLLQATPNRQYSNSNSTSLDWLSDDTVASQRHERIHTAVRYADLKRDGERTLINPDVVRDVVIGLSDGLTVPFALAAGLSSLGESTLVIKGGIAELIAGAISMGIGGFLAAQAERDHYRYQRRATSARVLRSCAGDMVHEVHAVLGPVGVPETVSRQVAASLQNAEDSDSLNGSTDATAVAEEGGAPPKGIGLTAFLLRFGEGLEDVPSSRMYSSAFTIGMGYLVGGLIPLLPYFFEPIARVALVYSCIVTGIVLLVFGAVKARVTGAAGESSVMGYIWGALSTLMVGGSAAAAAYGIVAALEHQ